MIASIIAYSLCGFLVGLAIVFCVATLKRSDGAETIIGFCVVIILGFLAWGAAFLGGLS